jgi:hypothetical protein
VVVSAVLDELVGLVEDGTDGPALSAATGRLLDGIAGGRLPVPGLRHPLGFLYLPLHRASDLTLRLHIWDPDLPPATLTTSPYHSHAWNLTSYVYCGQLENVLMRVRQVAEPPGYRVFEITGDGGIDALRPTGTLAAAEVATVQRVVAGEVYRIPAGVYHATGVDGRRTATVAVVRRRDALPERALGPIALGAHRVRREPVPADVVMRAAAAARAAAPAP